MEQTASRYEKTQIRFAAPRLLTQVKNAIYLSPLTFYHHTKVRVCRNK